MKAKVRLLRLAAIVLSLVMLAASPGSSALTAKDTPIGFIDMLPNTVTSTNLANEADYLRYRSLLNEYSDLLRTIYDGLAAGESSIDVSRFQLSTDYAPALIQVLFTCFPDICYIDRYRFRIYEGYLDTVIPVYRVDDPAATRRRFMEAAEKKYLSLVDDSMDDMMKVLILHDAILLNTRYETAAADGSVNCYTLMVEGYGACQDYTECFCYLLAQCGIRSEIVASGAMDHVWVKVRIGSHYYNIDPTWDDPLPDKAGRVGHLYFLLSDKAFTEADSTGNSWLEQHYGSVAIHPGDSEKYDNYKNLHSFHTRICRVKGACYAINSDGDLVKYNPANDAATVVSDLDFRWAAGTGSYWVGSYSSLEAYHDRLYYNSPDAVYEYDPATGKTRKYADAKGGKALYGIRIIDDQLMGVYADSPNEGDVTPTLMKKMDAEPPTTPPTEAPTAAPTAAPTEAPTEAPTAAPAVYRITVDKGIAHGKVTADRSTAPAGTKVTLTVTPDKDYAVTAVKVNGKALTAVNGVWSFVMPATDVAISATFENRKITLVGDPDGDGSITIQDASLIQWYLAGKRNVRIDLIAADMDCDSKVTINDATRIQKRVAYSAAQT